jgi:hypothetical protein
VALVEHLLAFGQLSDHPFECDAIVSRFLLAPSWSIETCVASGLVHGDPARSGVQQRTDSPVAHPSGRGHIVSSGAVARVGVRH